MNWWIICKSFTKFATCLLDNDNLWGKLVSPLKLPIIFDDNLKTTSVLFFIADSINHAVNLKIFSLNYYINPFYIDKK